MISLLAVSEQLGYTEVVDTIEHPISTTRSVVIEDRIRRLAAIDVALEEAAKNSVAEGVGDLRLNYSRHIATLRAEGSRLLKEISNLSGIAIRYDRYRATTTSQYSFRHNYG